MIFKRASVLIAINPFGFIMIRTSQSRLPRRKKDVIYPVVGFECRLSGYSAQNANR